MFRFFESANSLILINYKKNTGELTYIYHIIDVNSIFKYFRAIQMKNDSMSDHINPLLSTLCARKK